MLVKPSCISVKQQEPLPQTACPSTSPAPVCAQEQMEWLEFGCSYLEDKKEATPSTYFGPALSLKAKMLISCCRLFDYGNPYISSPSLGFSWPVGKAQQQQAARNTLMCQPDISSSER